MDKNTFNLLIFLMPLGAGGISLIPFSFLQYTFFNGNGLVTLSDISFSTLPFLHSLLFYFLFFIMIIFTIIHLVLTVILTKHLITWIKEKNYLNILYNPLINSSLLAPFISIIMSLNVFIGPIRFFIPSLSNNLQSFMFPALILWGIIWLFLMYLDLKLLSISFSHNFDISKINFGWLLHSFALGMLSVTGSGIAALSKNVDIAHVAAFMSLISASLGVFLLVVKLITLFKSHFEAKGLPEKEFLPSFLIVIPNITLFAITFFRLGHYLEHIFNFNLGPYFLVVILLSFVFEIWYLVFGLFLLKDYFKYHFFKDNFHISQWGLICPIVAFAILGSFLYKVYIYSNILYLVIILVILIAISLFLLLFLRQLKYDRYSLSMKNT
jgi:tellurite resistance protein TehA-like permease